MHSALPCADSQGILKRARKLHRGLHEPSPSRSGRHRHASLTVLCDARRSPGFLRLQHVFRALGIFPQPDGRNANGVNAGFYLDSAYPGHIHGFLLQGSTFTVVNHPSAANTWLFDVNLLGGTVGSFSAGQSVTKGFRLLNGSYTTIAYPNAQITNALAINDNGDVVGTYSSSVVSNGFHWKNGNFTTINFPYSKYGSILTGVNNVGVIVGNHLSADAAMGFIFENGVFRKIIYAGASYTSAGGINNNGLISGQIYITSKNTLGYTAVCK